MNPSKVKTTVAVFSILLATAASAQVGSILRHGPSKDQKKLMKLHNTDLRGSYQIVKPASRPYAEYEQAGYLIFSDVTYFEADSIKLALARELPKHVDLVVFTSSTSSSAIASIRKKYGNLVGGQLHILKTGSGNGFWARDGVPIPVYELDGSLRLVDAKYYHGFESDKQFSDFVGGSLVKHNYYYEGGNFMTDATGNCAIVNKTETALIPDGIFENTYGCQNLTRLEHISGIGHADEVIKFLSDSIAVTDKKAYVPTLEGLGYTVSLLPEPKNPYETYVNSLMIENKIFMPAYGQATDETAKRIYESFGYEVLALNSSRLSNYGHGSIHCITMTYPPVDIHVLAEAFKAKVVD